MKKNNRRLIILLLSMLIAGLVCNYFYQNSPKQAIPITVFQNQLIKKEQLAANTLTKLGDFIAHSPIDSLANFPFADNDISYYVFSNNELIFWSDNSLDISNIPLPNENDWHYIQLPNAHCVSRLATINSFKLLALIKVKNNYPFENDELKNNFALGFDMNKAVLITNGKKSDKLAVSCSHGNYLFTLSEPQMPIYNDTFSTLGLIAYSLAFLLFFVIYAQAAKLFGRRKISLKQFLIIFLSVGTFTGLCLFFNIPSLVFLNKLFSPFQYASNSFLASISHLTVATCFITSSIYLLYFHTNINALKNKTIHWIFLVACSAYFALFYYVLSGLIYHSSIQLSILKFNDFSIISIWIHFLILLWGIGMALLFYKTHNWFKIKHKIIEALLFELLLAGCLFLFCIYFFNEDAIRLISTYSVFYAIFYLPLVYSKHKNLYGNLVVWVFFFSGLVVINSVLINNNKKLDKYKILAQNIAINGNTDNDRMADILLEDLDEKISNDKKVARLVADTDSLSNANNYLNSRYLRGFWNKYEMRLNVSNLHSTLNNDYTQFISRVGTQLKNTHFYSVPANDNNMSYIGSFLAVTPSNDSLVFYMEFYPRRNFKSYSFPNLLIASAPDIQSKLNIGIAKYEHQRLVYSSGKFEYPTDINWMTNSKTGFFSIIYKGNLHYIYKQNSNTYIVITEQQPYDKIAYILYFAYTFLAFFAVCWLLLWIFQLTHRKRNYKLGLTTKFQYTFIGLLIISFLGIFYVSVNFIEQKYQEEQISNLESKKAYIQKALQDMYYWNQELNVQNTQSLNFDLQDLSYIYHTDIHVYDNLGVLIGSSQPSIFNKNLISNRISPIPFFRKTSNINQYEHIGRLNYLTGYTDFYNGDYLQIGYIAIPQFFSQHEIRNEIESFLTVIVHIYFIIIVLAILISLFIGKQLSAPLIILETKLKEMRIGRRNEKIEYSQNDEIGQLVIQYNRTVDELEQSARMLAKSERETAWKSMARQVAHEINNPLTPMKLSIQQLQRTKKLNDNRFDDYFERSTSMLIEQIDNLSRIAGTFSNFARMPEANFEKVDIAARLNSVVQLFENNNEQIKIIYNGDEKNIFVYADPEQLVQVFNNLLKNAMQAIPENREGEIKINMEQNYSQAVIHISDNGLGIDNEIHSKLFTPNFTTKNTGMGLGLAISKNIIELSGGTISFTTDINIGTTFCVTLPKETFNKNEIINQ